MEESRSGIVLLPPEILDAILRTIHDPCDKILFALTCKTFASIYANAKLSEKSQLKVTLIADGPSQTRYLASDLVCRLSRMWSYDLRFCPKCRLYRTCERAFWIQMREYIKETLRAGSPVTFGPKKKMIKLAPPRLHSSWSAIPAEVRSNIEVEWRLSPLNGRISEWCGLGRFLDPPSVETVSVEQRAGYWMDCPGHVFD